MKSDAQIYMLKRIEALTEKVTRLEMEPMLNHWKEEAFTAMRLLKDEKAKVDELEYREGTNRMNTEAVCRKIDEVASLEAENAMLADQIADMLARGLEAENASLRSRVESAELELAATRREVARLHLATSIAEELL